MEVSYVKKKKKETWWADRASCILDWIVMNAINSPKWNLYVSAERSISKARVSVRMWERCSFLFDPSWGKVSWFHTFMCATMACIFMDVNLKRDRGKAPHALRSFSSILIYLCFFVFWFVLVLHSALHVWCRWNTNQMRNRNQKKLNAYYRMLSWSPWFNFLGCLQHERFATCNQGQIVQYRSGIRHRRSTFIRKPMRYRIFPAITA